MSDEKRNRVSQNQHEDYKVQNDNWTHQRIARWITAWHAVLAVHRALWFGAFLGISLLIQHASGNIRLPFDSDDQQRLIVSWVAVLITLAVCAGPVVWLLGQGKKHVVREPLRGAIWIVRGLNAAFLICFAGLMYSLVVDWDRTSGDWNQIPIQGYTLILIAAIGVWTILFAFANPLALKPFRDFAFCVDSLYRQSSGKATHSYIVRLFARGELEAERVDNSNEYRAKRVSNSQTGNRAMSGVWATMIVAVLVLGGYLLVGKISSNAQANNQGQEAEPSQRASINPDASAAASSREEQPKSDRQDLSQALQVAEARLARQQEQARIAQDAAIQRQREIQQQALLVQEIQRRELARAQAEQEAVEALRIRRWWMEWDNRGRGTLVIQMANHGSRPIHVNQASVQQGRWTYVAQYVQAGSTLTHRIGVSQEPIYVDLETTVGTLRFDLIPDR